MKCGVGSVQCKVWSVECKVASWECRMWGMQNRLECCERNRNVKRTHPQPLDPQSETVIFATHSGKRHDMEERQSFEKARNRGKQQAY